MHIELEHFMARMEDLEKETAALQAGNRALHADNEALKARNASLHTRVDAAETRSRRERRRLRIQAGLAFTGLLAAVLVSPANRAAIAQGYGVTLASLNARVSAVEGKTQYMSVDTKAQSTTFSGCNLFVNDGGGATSSIVTNSAGEGLGNLIIGYNSPVNPTGNGAIRTGSHNLVLGDVSNYSSYGGLVAGNINTISSPYASVTGGQFNEADGFCSSVSGGTINEASGSFSSVSGGVSNTASGFEASVSGGIFNTASGGDTSVSGGGNNTANGAGASIGGGAFVTESTFAGWAAGSYHSP